MPRGIPRTLSGWTRRLSNLPTAKDWSPEKLREVAEKALARTRRRSRTLPQTDDGESPVTIEDLLKQHPELSERFQRLWTAAYDDTEGTPEIRKALAQQQAMALLTMERLQVETFLSPHVGSESWTALDRANLIVMRYAQAMRQTPATRRADRADDDSISDLLAAAERGKYLADHAEELAREDAAFLEEAALDEDGVGVS